MTFSKKILDFHFSLRPDWVLPADFELIYPYNHPDTKATMTAFFEKYYSDEKKRLFVFGINPGRFGAGITGVPFTDPIRLETECSIINPFKKRQELSSVFIYEVVEAFGGAAAIYEKIYITSLSPLGFLKDGKNANYYDDKRLEKAVEPYIIENINTQLDFGGFRHAAVCLGQGKNFKYFKKLNEKWQWFEEIYPLPHPRWVMQYRRKKMDFFREEYLRVLNKSLLV